MELYHVLNRGVEKRNIFLDDRDYVRFVHDLFEFNCPTPVTNVQYRFKNMDFVSPYFEKHVAKRREKLVDIHAWCLMKNHYHLLLSERTDGGLTSFIRKLNIGYAKYFNERYRRSGTLFQGRTKKKLIDTDAYFLHILHYIHLNPLDYHRGSTGWRDRKVTDSGKALEHLHTYRWSSYLDYAGRKNFPSILTTEFFQNVFGNVEQTTRNYIRELQLDDVQSYLLE